jgi:hypothetical protein
MTETPTHIAITILDASAPQQFEAEPSLKEPETDIQPVVENTPQKPTGGNTP